jgi:hypothetical protein
MNKEHLIKDGKFYNPETATLIAFSTWYVNYKIKRHKIYKSAKGVFFKVVEIAESGHQEPPAYPYPFIVLKDGSHVSNGEVLFSEYSLSPNNGGFRDDVKIKEVKIESELSEKQAREMLEYTMQGGVYAPSHHSKTKYAFLMTYDELFSVTEA